MNNSELLTTVLMQTGTAHAEVEALTATVLASGCVLKHEALPALETIVTRLGQAYGAAVELQRRAHGGELPKHG